MKHQRKSKHIRQKQHEKRFAQWFAAGSVAFVLLAIGGLLFWHSKQPPLEPVKIYKTVPLSEIKQRQLSTPETTGSASHTHHPDDGHTHKSVSSDVSTDTPETVLTDDAVSAETDGTSALEWTDADLAASEHEVLHAKLERIQKEFETILAEINEKYPEVREVMSISHEELHRRYPTQAARDALNERLDQMRSEFKDRAIQLLSELPTERQLEYIIRIDEQISKTHGDEAANEMTAELLDKLKL